MEWALVMGIVGVISLVASFVARWDQFMDAGWEDVGIFLLGVVGLGIGVLLVARYFLEYGESSALSAALSLVGGLLLAILGIELIIISANWEL